MPRFNPFTGNIALLRRVWFDKDNTVYQDCSNSIDGKCKVVLSDGEVIQPGVNTSDVCAGGGSIVAWRDINTLTVYDNLKRSFPDAGLPQNEDGGPDGSYPLKVLRNSFGPWDVIEKDSPRWRLTDGDAYSIQLLGNQKAIFKIGDIIFVTKNIENLIELPLSDVWSVRVAWTGSRYIVAGQRKSDGAMLCDGHVILPGGDYFYHDIEYRDNLVRVCWSPDSSDATYNLFVATLDQVHSYPLDEITPSPVPPKPIPPKPKEMSYYGLHRFTRR